MKSNSTPRMSRLNPQVFLNGLLLIVTLAGIAWLVEITPVRSLLDKAWIEQAVLGQGIRGEVLFLGAGALAVALGAPRQIVSFLAGYAFGIALGTALGLTATLAGCLLNFTYARWFGRALVTAKFRERVHRIEAFVRGNTFQMTLLIRLLPVGNNLVTNLAAGVAGVRATPFLLGSALGYIPQTFVFALIGSGISVDPLYRTAIGATLFLLSGVLGIQLFRRLRHGRRLDAALEQELGVEDT
ncbi:MAG: VTT domain-containing protein [Pseudomonadota bacterium]